MSQNTPEPKKDESVTVVFGIAIALGLLVMKDTIPLLCLLAGGVGAWRLWKRYVRKRQDKFTHLDQVFYRLIRENDGWITPLDLAMNAQVPSEDVREFLDQKASEFSAQFEVTEQGGILYYFSTAQSLISSLEEEKIDGLPNIKAETVTAVDLNSEKPGEVSLFPVPLSPTPASLDIPENLNQLELAKRFNVHPSTLSKWKTKPQFKDWCYQRDPDHIIWQYSEEKKRFYPIIPQSIKSQGNPFLSQNLKKRQAN